MIYGLLATVSFSFTKVVGLERTIILFEKMGTLFSFLRRGKVPDPEEIYESVKRGYGWLPFAVRCLDQSVVTWFALNWHGYSASLKIGITLSPLASHAWVTLGEKVFVDSFWISDMEVLASYPPWSFRKTVETRKALA